MAKLTAKYIKIQQNINKINENININMQIISYN